MRTVEAAEVGRWPLRPVSGDLPARPPEGLLPGIVRSPGRGAGGEPFPVSTRGRGAFTLLELLIVVAILGVLAALLVPAALEALETAYRTACASNLRQIGIAMQRYLNDNDGLFFALREPNDPTTPEDEARLWYFGYERGTDWLATAEGERVLDRTRAKLYPYLQDYESVEVCPAFDYAGSYKAKFRGRWWTYGINRELAPDRFLDPRAPHRSQAEIAAGDLARTVVFADAAQVNTFQPPASPSNPMVEEWHYVQPPDAPLPDYPHVHFRHGGLANVLFADWHVEAVGPAPGSFDPRLPTARIGHLDPSAVRYRPGRGR